MEELTKRNGKGMWLREIEKGLKRFGASLEWLIERISLRNEEVDAVLKNGEWKPMRRQRCSGQKG